jgi:hypothetical protein
MSDDSGDFAFADDLSWIVGRLEREEFEGGFWRLQFGTTDDPYGGEVVLGNPPALSGAHAGALVRVEGRPEPDAMSIWMAGTLYDVASAHEVAGGATT